MEVKEADLGKRNESISEACVSAAYVCSISHEPGHTATERMPCKETTLVVTIFPTHKELLLLKLAQKAKRGLNRHAREDTKTRLSFCH